MVAKAAALICAVFLLSTNTALASTYGSHLCHQPGYSCYTVKRGQTWQSLFTDPARRDLVMRLNRMDTRLYPRLVIAIPQSNDNNLMDYAPLPKQIDPPGEKYIFVSVNKLAFGAYNPDGNLVYWGPVSTGRDYCPDIHRGCRTTLGTYRIHEKEGPGCESSKFPVGRGGAPMPWCMYFHGGFALHGSYEVPGYNDSHGCVRMFVVDAKWLNQDFTYDDNDTKVVISK